MSGVCLVNLLLEPPIYRKSSRGNSSRLKSEFDVCYVQIAGADAAAWVQAQGMAAGSHGLAIAAVPFHQRTSDHPSVGEQAELDKVRDPFR